MGGTRYEIRGHVVEVGGERRGGKEKAWRERGSLAAHGGCTDNSTGKTPVTTTPQTIKRRGNSHLLTPQPPIKILINKQVRCVELYQDASNLAVATACCPVQRCVAG